LDDSQEFESQNREAIHRMGADGAMAAASRAWFEKATEHQYSYHFKWMGLPIIQFPQDIVAMQELIWDVKPDLIIETGVARGGSLVFYASLLELIGGNGLVVGIDIDIRPHNRKAIESHPLARRIRMVEGSSVDVAVVAQIKRIAEGRKRVIVALDSNHTHDHVLGELRHYSTFVTEGSYLVVFDTCVEFTPDALIHDRPWRKGDNPWTAVQAFLREDDRFEVQAGIHRKLQVTVCPDGYLKRIR
jgi:cephalosporin hydroxylase